jgi:hypothetical protein
MHNKTKEEVRTKMDNVVVIKVKRYSKFYRFRVNDKNVCNFRMEVAKHDKGIFEVFRKYNSGFDVLERSLKFYPSYSKEMQETFNDSVFEMYIMDCILNYIITDIGDIYIKRDYSIFKHLKMAKVVIV